MLRHGTLCLLMSGLHLLPGCCAYAVGNDPEIVLHDYFDIAVGSVAGTEVTGRLNLERNRHAPTTPVPADYAFTVVEDSSNGMFVLHNQRDAEGRLFGVFRVSAGETAQRGIYELLIDLRESGEMKQRLSVVINVVPETQWQRFLDRVVPFVDGSERLTGRRSPLGDDDVTRMIEELEANDGAFADMQFYGVTTAAVVARIGLKGLSRELSEASGRIGALGKAYHRTRNSQARTRLRHTLYRALIKYIDGFPLQNFADSRFLGHSDRTHQWRFADGISGAGALIAADMYKDIEQGHAIAASARDSIVRFLRYINFDLPAEWRLPSHRRYFAGSGLAESNGAWSDANRHHRMRSWVTMPVVMRDYNQPLTDVKWWYDDYEPFKTAGTTLLPGWQPSGSFADLKYWLETNVLYAHTFGQSGVLPDGGISHHVGHRQDLAFWAYGFEWLTDTAVDAFGFLANTPWQVSDDVYTKTAEFLLFAYQRLIFESGIDFQVTGRSFYKDAGTFGRKRLVRGIDRLFDSRLGASDFPGAVELRHFRNQLVDESHEYSTNSAFWVNDFMVHRRGANQDEQGFYMSVKMNSARSRGAESFHVDGIGFHNGSGVLQVMVDGDEYDKARYRWDWHALPGITEELRTDPTPLQSEANLFSSRHFAGVASNGTNGLAAFDYSSDNPYASVEAGKAWFFAEDRVLALGNNVRRVRNTDGSDGEPVITTVDQAVWKTDITWWLGGDAASRHISRGDSVDLVLRSNGNSWFHQNRTGYFVIGRGTVNLMLRGGASIRDSDPGDSAGIEVFHLAVDHGKNPDGSGETSKYAYVIVPNVAADEMSALMADIERETDFINNPTIQGLRTRSGDIEIVQVAFRGPGAADFTNGLRISTDKAAIVQLQRGGEQWEVTVQDPTHHVDDSAVEALDRFGHILNQEANRIVISLNIPLKPGRYHYRTQGPEPRFFRGQTARVEVASDGVRQVTVELPDRQDADVYGSKQDLYAGMPASFSVPVE